jgi:hypothetical protein
MDIGLNACTTDRRKSLDETAAYNPKNIYTSVEQYGRGTMPVGSINSLYY